MSKSYQQLTEDERIDIFAMRQEGKTVSQMADALGRNQSTLYREVDRNSGQRGYRPKQAHRKATERRAIKRKATKMTRSTMAYIQDKLALQWSPDQISNAMLRATDYVGHSVSHERIYLYIGV